MEVKASDPVGFINLTNGNEATIKMGQCAAWLELPSAMLAQISRVPPSSSWSS